MPTAGEIPLHPDEKRFNDLLKKAQGEKANVTTPSDVDHDIVADKEIRRSLDAILQGLKAGRSSRERALAITKLQEAIMWLGMDLKRLNDLRPTPEPGPYPSSYDPSNTKVEPTADGLKL